MAYDMDEIFKFLSIDTKRKIILHLYTCKCNHCSVTNLCCISQCKQANISKHLMDLKKAKIVYYKKDKTSVRYFLEQKFIEEYRQILNFILENKHKGCSCK